METFILTNNSLGLPGVKIPATTEDWYLEQNQIAYTLTKTIRSNKDYVSPPVIIIRLNEITEPGTVSFEEYNTVTPIHKFKLESGSYVLSRRIVVKSVTETKDYQFDIIGICSSTVAQDCYEVAQIMDKVKIILSQN